MIIQFALDIFTGYFTPTDDQETAVGWANMLNPHLELSLQADVMNALHWNIAIPRHRVTANVARGVVTLEGLVEWPYQKFYAEATVRRVLGVIDVRNEISVRAAQRLRQSTLAA